MGRAIAYFYVNIYIRQHRIQADWARDAQRASLVSGRKQYFNIDTTESLGYYARIDI